MVASRNSHTINTTDLGTVRRFKQCISKTEFCTEPDPNNPHERTDNQYFSPKWTSDPST